jgi:radical SAM superfamily enzyme YgiQ (UPF0313 family)
MKVTFLSLGLSTDAIGPRILSSLLKKNGYQSQLLFLPTVEDLKRRATHSNYHYSENVLKQIIDLSMGSDLIGISLMTHHKSIAFELTKRIKKSTATPIIWGGIHPTVCPEECLETADMVCFGEAETSLLELVRCMSNHEDISGIPGIWIKKDGQVVNNGAGALAKELDSLPFPDYSFEDHHLLIGDNIEPMTPENWRRHLIKFFPPLNCDRPENPAYQVLSARGCPYKCTFCGEYPLTENIYGRRYFRKRSVSNLMEELIWAKNAFPFIGEICFCDDTFSSRSISDLQDFARQYKEKIALPFYILVSPANVTQEKFDLLVDAGLTNIGMGIQSGSRRIIELYDRQHVGSVDQSLKAAHILNSYKDRLLPYYDFIIENPYETNEDLLETVRLLVKLPRPYITRVYALSFFPGTALHKKACADGIFFDDMYDITFGQRHQGGYLNFLVDMNKYRIPQKILEVLISRPFLFLLNRPLIDRFFLLFHRFLKLIAMKLHLHERGLS